ncbi:MAG: hypothetical protein QM750_13065 [Rubrivivax sp.]
MRLARAAAGAALLAIGAGPALAASATAGDCGRALDARHRQQISAGAQQLAWAPQPGPLRAGRMFAVEVVLCPAGATLGKVDAEMPAHRHGMNYRPTIRALGDGRFRAEGLLLHMPGRWRFSFELDGLRLSQERDVE